jgi:hypothetical protein
MRDMGHATRNMRYAKQDTRCACRDLQCAIRYEKQAAERRNKKAHHVSGGSAAQINASPVGATLNAAGVSPRV